MIDHWNKKRSNQESDIMFQSGQRGKNFSLFCMCLGHVSVNARLIQFIFENLSNWRNPNLYKNYTLYIEGYYPYTWNYSPIFEITSFTQYFGIFVGTIAYTGTDGFFSLIVLHLSGQYQILRLQLSDIVNEVGGRKSWTEFNERFSKIIFLHEHINRFLILLNYYFNIIILHIFISLKLFAYDICF